LLNFDAVSFNLFLDFFSARQPPEIILNESNESFENTKNAFIEWLRKETTKYFPKTKECSFLNWFWILFSFSGWSQICKKRNAWILPSWFLRNTLIQSSEKMSWSLKTSILK
jgi:hypothetical protein